MNIDYLIENILIKETHILSYSEKIEIIETILTMQEKFTKLENGWEMTALGLQTLSDKSLIIILNDIYILNAGDPDNDELFYYVDWDDGTYDDWFGPFASGTDTIASHIWNEKGEYTIKVKAKDTFGHESDWATLPVTMPRNRLLTSPFFMRLLERFPNAFPILRHLMGL